MNRRSFFKRIFGGLAGAIAICALPKKTGNLPIANCASLTEQSCIDTINDMPRGVALEDIAKDEYGWVRVSGGRVAFVCNGEDKRYYQLIGDEWQSITDPEWA